jgi:hypothetical protein
MKIQYWAAIIVLLFTFTSSSHAGLLDDISDVIRQAESVNRDVNREPSCDRDTSARCAKRWKSYLSRLSRTTGYCEYRDTKSICEQITSRKTRQKLDDVDRILRGNF